MLDRSRAGRALSAACAVVCLLLIPAAARAASPFDTGKRPVPADAPVVATTPSGYAVIAWVVGGRTCTVFQAPGAARPTTLFEGDVDLGPTSEEQPNGLCETTPVLSQFHAASLRSQTVSGSTTLVWGVAGPGSARLELRRAATVQASSPTTAAPLPGPAAGLRFWALAQASDAQEPDEVAVLDAAGTVRRAFSLQDLLGGWGPYSTDQNEPTAKGTLLQRGHTGTTTWELRRTVKQQLESTPLQPERRVEVRCLTLATKVARSSTADRDAGPCDDGLIRVTPLLVAQGTRCGVGTSIMVLARAPVRSAVIVLGDGRRRAVALNALGGASAVRGGAVLVSPELAVRRVEGLGAGGQVVRTWPLGAAPVSDPSGCTGGSFSSDFVTTSLRDLFDDNYGAPPHTLHAIDSGAELCVNVDREPRVPLDCGVPPADPEAASVGVVDVPGGQYLYGLVPVEVAAARITFTDKTTQTVPATPIPGYRGQYAGTTAQIALDISTPRVARSAVLLDVNGRVLGKSEDLGPVDFAIGRTTTLRPASDGLPALRAAPMTVTLLTEKFRSVCVGFSRVTSVFGSCLLSLTDRTSGPSTIQVVSRCSPRRFVVLAALRRATDRLVIRLRDGREVVARSYYVPATADIASSDHYAALAVLKPHDAIAGLRLRGKAARKVKASYPAAADQCGYGDTPSSLFS
ncbi:hypothetical protein [Baekduia sp. Peel2402]|uniref:hypothetical protein n=1 Tax=Baekduia sp. Peel2402 TaxID=3458296 RepID=UPI00403E4E4D